MNSKEKKSLVNTLKKIANKSVFLKLNLNSFLTKNEPPHFPA